MSLTAQNAAQTQSTVWLWVLLYGYGLRLYFDFSGYTDIAIGIGILFGITLPENFKRPYLKTTLTAFWQSWHMTLSSWARFYVFSPFSRWMLMRRAQAVFDADRVDRAAGDDGDHRPVARRDVGVSGVGRVARRGAVASQDSGAIARASGIAP